MKLNADTTLTVSGFTPADPCAAVAFPIAAAPLCADCVSAL